MSPIVPVSLAAVIVASIVFPVQAAQPKCLTNELESELINSPLAVSAGQCHLAAAVAEPEQALDYLQYAYSWFSLAEQLQTGSSAGLLDQVRRRLERLTQHASAPTRTAQQTSQ